MLNNICSFIRINNFKYKFTYIFILFFIVFFDNLSFGEILKQEVQLKYLKTNTKSKLIFQPRIDGKKILYPKKVVFDIYDYNKNPFFTYLGIPSEYKIVMKKYLILTTFYASGGSGSIDNIYLIDLIKPRLWHLASGETVAENSEYVLSKDENYLVAYDTLLFNHLVILKFDNKNNPILLKKISKKELSKDIIFKFKKDIEINNIECSFNKNILSIFLNKEEDLSYQLNYDIKNDTFLSIDNKKNFTNSLTNNSKESEDIDKIYSPNKLFYLKKENINDKDFFSINDTNTHNKIFSSNILNNLSFKWIYEDKFLFIDFYGLLHILEINDKKNIRNIIIKNLPKINNVNSNDFSLFSNLNTQNICLIINNNLFFIDLKKFTVKKLTNNKSRLKINQYKEIELSNKNPLMSYPYIIDNKVFYSLIVSYDIFKLMFVKY